MWLNEAPGPPPPPVFFSKTVIVTYNKYVKVIPLFVSLCVSEAALSLIKQMIGMISFVVFSLQTKL